MRSTIIRRGAKKVWQVYNNVKDRQLQKYESKAISGRCPKQSAVELDGARLEDKGLVKILGNYRDRPEDMTQHLNENNVLSVAQGVENQKLPKLIQVIAFPAWN